MERELLSRVTGNSFRQRLQGQEDPRPPPSPALTLHLGAQEAPRSRADATIRGHARAAPQQQQPHAPSPAADVAASLPTTSRAPFASDRVASVVVPGFPMAQRRHNLRAGAAAGARAQTCAPRASPAGPAPQWWPAPMTVPAPTATLQLAGPTVATGEERCAACGLSSAQLLRGLSSDLDRARARVALLTCQNESLRYRLKRAAAEPTAATPAASSAHLNLRCGGCRVRPATVVLAPREHLCLCRRCSDAAVTCPVCRAAVGTGPAEAAPPR